MKKITHISNCVLDSKAPLSDERLPLVVKVFGDIVREGEAGQCQEGSQIGGIETRENCDEDPPGCEGDTNRIGVGRENRSLFHQTT